jgi:hypothetical protein
VSGMTDTQTFDELTEQLSEITSDLLDRWKDPYKAPEAKAAFGQQAINEFAATLSEYAVKLGLVPS